MKLYSSTVMSTVKSGGKNFFHQNIRFFHYNIRKMHARRNLQEMKNISEVILYKNDVLLNFCKGERIARSVCGKRELQSNAVLCNVYFSSY